MKDKAKGNPEQKSNPPQKTKTTDFGTHSTRRVGGKRRVIGRDLLEAIFGDKQP